MSELLLKNPQRWLGFLPTLTVLALLGFVGYFGHKQGWRWEEKQEKKAEVKKNAGEADEPSTPFDENPQTYSVFDPTMPITHDAAKCKFDKKDIDFKDSEAVRKAGIFTGVIRKREMDDVLTVTASVDHDPTRVARVSARTNGIIWRIGKKEGDDVAPGELLAIVESGDVGKAKAAFFHAKVQLDLKEQVRNRLQAGVSPERALLEADAALREARVQLQTTYQALVNLGFKLSLTDAEKASDTELLERLQSLGLEKEVGGAMQIASTNNLLAVRCPLEVPGDVLQRDGVMGESVAAGQMIFIVGDCRQMALALDIRQEDQQKVRKGQTVKFTPDGFKEPIVTKIDRIGHDLDPKTRAVKAFAFIENPRHQLKAHAFGKATITIRSQAEVLAVPEEAIQWEGCSHIVFVLEFVLQKDDEKRNGDVKGQVAFEVRRVTLGTRRGGFVEVSSGVKEGDIIAVLGSHVLKSHLFKDRIGSAEE